MTTEQRNVSRSYLSHEADLEKACVWLGTSMGRASKYGKLIREFFEENGRSTQHILAYNESCEIVDIYEMWHSRVDYFPGILEKIRSALLSGTFLQEEEHIAASSNRPRNEAFTYLVAGELLRAGLHVSAVDGIAALGASNTTKSDVRLEWQKQPINIECKRPRAFQALAKRTNEAYKQLLSSNSASFGVAAIDCSALVRRPRTLVEAASAEDADRFVSRTLEATVLPKAPNSPSARILGIGLFARVPVMVRTGRSTVIAPTGRYYTNFAPCSVSSWLFVSNPTSSNGHLLKALAAAFYSS